MLASGRVTSLEGSPKDFALGKIFGEEKVRQAPSAFFSLKLITFGFSVGATRRMVK